MQTAPWAREGEGGKEAAAAPGSHALLAGPPHPLPCTHACLVPCPSFSPLLLGIKWFPPWPHAPSGRGAGRDLATPSLPRLRSHHASSVPVCCPRLLLCLSSRRLLLVPLSTAASSSCQLTFLGFSPSLPVSFLPSAPHRDGPGRAPPPLPLPLCPVSLSLSVL